MTNTCDMIQRWLNRTISMTYASAMKQVFTRYLDASTYIN